MCGRANRSILYAVSAHRRCYLWDGKARGVRECQGGRDIEGGQQSPQVVSVEMAGKPNRIPIAVEHESARDKCNEDVPSLIESTFAVS